MPSLLCVNCQTEIQEKWYFCPNCGMQLQDKPRALIISPSKQAVIYAVSFFLAPLGLGWGIKYIRDTDPKVKRVGWIAIILTIVSIVLMVTILQSFMNKYTTLMNQIMNGSYVSY
ncbi:MAG: hypothetical protein RI947_314 [Candidatus Parcubacteria bacterium]